MAALEAHADTVRAAGGLRAVSALREFEPSARVAARLELSSGRTFRGRSAGADVMGDGSVIPYAGGMMRRPLELDHGESPYAVIRRELER